MLDRYKLLIFSKYVRPLGGLGPRYSLQVPWALTP
jgi:hypothetical protein